VSGDAYAAAGVDVAAGDKAVELMKAAVGRTHGPSVLGGVGGFAGLWDALDLKGYEHPILATSTDGVGTKIAIAQAMGVHHTVGLDLVGMVVDDLVVCGARPLFMTDYIATGHVDPVKIASIVGGIAAGCEATDTALIGGETAEHPGVMAPDEYDIAGAAVGVVDQPRLLGAHRVAAGDVVLALPSSGLHSNGFSLVRAVVARLGLPWETPIEEFGRSLGQEVLEPTRLYARPCLALAEALGDGLHAFSHVTGGGLAANLARVLPAGLGAVVSRSSWEVPPVFQWLRRVGDVAWASLERTLNLGVGMVALVTPDAASRAIAVAAGYGLEAVPIGRVASLSEFDAAARAAGAEAGDIVQGAKGVDGGSVLLTDSYR
jgi:phosphoribosylformylglycinamidine cyclo-ligase